MSRAFRYNQLVNASEALSGFYRKYRRIGPTPSDELAMLLPPERRPGIQPTAPVEFRPDRQHNREIPRSLPSKEELKAQLDRIAAELEGGMA